MANKNYWSVSDAQSIIEVLVDIRFCLRIKIMILTKKNKIVYFSNLKIKFIFRQYYSNKYWTSLVFVDSTCLGIFGDATSMHRVYFLFAFRRRAQSDLAASRRVRVWQPVSAVHVHHSDHPAETEDLQPGHGPHWRQRLLLQTGQRPWRPQGTQPRTHALRRLPEDPAVDPGQWLLRTPLTHNTHTEPHQIPQTISRAAITTVQSLYTLPADDSV